MNHANNNTGFDNVYYLEKGEKKDSKSRGRVAAVQAEAREKKIAEQICQLPKKMQAKLTENTIAPVTNTGKSKKKHVTKTFHSRQKTRQNLLLEEYNEEILVKKDVVKEHIDETFEKRWDEYIDAMEEEKRIQEEEERYQTYLYEAYGDLAAFYLEPDYASHPDYEFRLKTAIKKYEEDEWNAQKAREEVH